MSSAAGAEPWDGWWTLSPSRCRSRSARAAGRCAGQLRWLGYAPLYDGLWISPRPLTERHTAQLAPVNLGAMTVFRARHVDLDAGTGRDPLQAWDIAAIAGQYESLHPALAAAAAPDPAGQVGGAEAVRARTEVMDTYRRFAVLDPRLPIPLLPSGWLRKPARTSSP